MNTLLVSVLTTLAHGVLFYNVPDVLGQPLPNHHKTAWAPYPMARPSQQPVQMGRYISLQEHNQPSTFNQVQQGSHQQHQSSEVNVASAEVHSGEYDEYDYPHRSTGIREDDDNVDDWVPQDEDNRDHNTDSEENVPAEESQIRLPEMMRIQLHRPAQLEDWEKEEEEEETYFSNGDQVVQTKLPTSDDVELFPRGDPENSTAKYELIPEKHEPVTPVPATQNKPTEQPRETSTQAVTLVPATQNKPTEPPRETSTQPTPTRKETSRFETLRKPHLPSHKLQKSTTVPLKYKNYPIPHSDNTHKYLPVFQRLYLNPELHSDLYTISDHSIHDSMILPEAKAAARAKLPNA